MERGYLGSPDLRPLESRLIYERSRGVSFRVLEERSARTAGGLFGPAEFAERRDFHRLVRVTFFAERKVEHGGYDEAVGRILQNAGAVAETHLGVGQRLHFTLGDVPYVGGNEHVGGFEAEAPGVSDYGSSEAARKADPGDEARKSQRSEKQGYGVDFLSGMDFEPSGRDRYRIQRRRRILKMPESGEGVLYQQPREPVEGEEAVGSVTEERHGKSGGFRRGDRLGKDRQIGFRGDLEKIRRFRGRFKSRKGAHVPFGHYGRWKGVRHTFSMVSRKGAKSNGATRRGPFDGIGQVRHPPSAGGIWR